MNALPLLHAARRLVADHGWQRDYLGNPYAGYSTEGAIYDAAGLLDNGRILDHPSTPVQQTGARMADAAFAVLAAELGVEAKPRTAFAVVVEWNAYEPTSAYEVLALLDAAIAHATPLPEQAA